MILLIPPKHIPTPFTLVLSCPDQLSQDELLPLLKGSTTFCASTDTKPGCVVVLTQLLYENDVCVGGGCTEYFLVRYLRLQAETLKVERVKDLDKLFVEKPSSIISKIKHCIHIFADCLEAQIKQLERDQSTSAEVLLELEQANNQPLKGLFYGWNPVLKKCEVMMDKGKSVGSVLESLSNKQRMLQAASELAAIVLKIGPTFIVTNIE